MWLSPPWRGLYHTCTRHSSTHLFGYLSSLSFPRARRDMEHTCVAPSLPTSFPVLCVTAPSYSLCKWACGGGGFASYMHGLIFAVCLHRGAVCNILALCLPTSYRVVLATALFSVAWHITYLCPGGRWHCCCLCVFCICLLSCVLLCACVPFFPGWGAHKSLAPRARTLLGVLGQATLRFFAVATLLFFFFCECPKFCDLAKQRCKNLGVFLRSEKTILCFIFSGCASFSWFLLFSAACAMHACLLS